MSERGRAGIAVSDRAMSTSATNWGRGMKTLNCMLAALTISIAFGAGLQNARADSLRWVCRYEAMASPSGTKQESFRLEFVLDTLTKKALLIGNAGVSDLDVFNGDQAITFQEKLATGAIQTTTISHTDGRSVHSRHSVMNGTFVPSQYYGICK